MKTKVDAVGRVVLPKPLREALGLRPGSVVDISLYGQGLQIVPGGRTAKLEKRGNRVVLVSKTTVTDADIYRLIDEGRR